MSTDPEPTKRPTRDYQSLSSTPWTLWDVIYGRRSVRRYEPAEPDQAFSRSLHEFLSFALEVSGSDPDSVVAVTEPGQVRELQARSCRGMLNKINRWMVNAPLLGFLAVCCDLEELGRDRPVRLARSALAAEDAVLWLSEQGYGSCWLGAINREEARRFLGLPPEKAVPLLICLGKPRARSTLSVDNFMYQAVSRRRKPLQAIAFSESAQDPYLPPVLTGKSCRAAERQDILSLLRFIYAGEHPRPDVPLELLVDACLEAARVAPNSSNSQSWRFTVVREEKTLERLHQACRAGRPWRAAIVGSAEAGNMNALLLDRPFWMIDLPIAFAHMSLMAASLHCLTKLRMDEIEEREISGLLKLPEKLRTGGVLGIF